MSENKTKVFCFLDIDGVIATEKAVRDCWLEVQGLNFEDNTPADSPLPLHRTSGEYWPFDREALAAFHKLQLLFIKKDVEMHTVLSSTWRLDSKDLEFHKSRFALKGLHILFFHGLTSFRGKTRGDQIMQYVEEHNIENFFVIDDDINDIEGIVPNDHIFETKFMHGMGNDMIRKIYKYHLDTLG